jgi:hypothetical protein
MWYEPGFYIPEDGILHRQCRENLRYYESLHFVGRCSVSEAFDIVACSTEAVAI